jgi:undecaprenyl-phosphate 4-deoxy-4-formamido-L-arabinose transferase
MDTLSIIVPVYNGEGTITALVNNCLDELLPKHSSMEIVLVNDGSSDNSHSAILKLLSSDAGKYIRYAQLSKNFGEHNAVMCGLNLCRGDVAIIIDDDFQNPPQEISKIVTKLKEGFDVVYSYYEKKQHSWFRNLGSKFHNKIATILLNKPSDLYLSSFKGVNRFVIDAIKDYNGPYPYVDGLILRCTRSIGVQLCDHQARTNGESNYTIRKLISLWLNMFTSFSVVPLRVASYLGIFMASTGFCLALWFIFSWYIDIGIPNNIPKGWASLIVSVTTFSGIQLLVLGVIGEYVGRMFLTQNRQPQFVVRSLYENSSTES